MDAGAFLTMDAPASAGEVALRMVLATAFGACLGWDRESRRKAAGVRTHMLLSLGAAVFTLTAFEMFRLTIEQSSHDGDPTRLLQGLVSGIGFLGAGQIIQARGSVRGLTTAAGIWVVGAIGVACGGGAYLIAGLSTLLALLILRGVPLIEGAFVRPGRTAPAPTARGAERQ